MTDITESELSVSFFSPGVADDPHPTYRTMRKACPVARASMGETPVVLISRYEDVN